jgi:DNA-binding transcriptional ArsR family regulator
MNMKGTAESLLKLMAHPIRLMILRHLRGGECCVSRMIECFQIPQPNISQHLKLLLSAKIVRVEQRGRKRCYSLADPRVEKILAVLDGAISPGGAGRKRR